MNIKLKQSIENHEWIPLWDKQPYEIENTNYTAAISAFFVPHSQWCVVILPGGGYFQLSETGEGIAIAEAYNRLGVSATVVKYRYKPYDGRATMADGQRGLQLTKEWLETLGVQNRIAVCGFSAGGHLATMLCQHDENHTGNEEIVPSPKACILSYAVTTLSDGTFPTMPPIFLGETDPWATPDMYSYYYHPEKMPPTLLWYSRLDNAVDYIKNSEATYKCLQALGVPSEIHVYADGGHGIGLGLPFPDCSQWLITSVRFLLNL